MFIKTLILLVLAAFAFAKPQDDIQVDHPDVDVNAIENRIEFITNFHHAPVNNKEGGVITVTYGPPDKDADKASQLVKSFTIAIGTGKGKVVEEPFFMESERLPIPTGPTTYKIQLPAQMEKKQYCMVYTPYSTATVEEGNTKATTAEGAILESLYETWFAIDGSLAEGAGPKTAENTMDNSAATGAAGASTGAAAGAAKSDDATAAAAAGSTDRSATNNISPNAAAAQSTQAANAKSGSITISPAITLFIAVLFACFFI